MLSISRLGEWIDTYVRDKLGPDVCGNDFVDHLYRRAKRQADSTSLPPSLDERIRNMLKILVFQERMRIYRVSRRYVPVAHLESCGHPASLEFAEILETEAEARFFLESIPEDLRPIIKHLYGLDGERVRSRKEIAKSLGVKINTLNQRLRRLYERLRANRNL